MTEAEMPEYYYNEDENLVFAVLNPRFRELIEEYPAYKKISNETAEMIIGKEKLDEFYDHHADAYNKPVQGTIARITNLWQNLPENGKD